MPVNEPHLPRVNIVALYLSPYPEGEITAVHSLEVPELHHRHRRVRFPSDDMSIWRELSQLQR